MWSISHHSLHFPRILPVAIFDCVDLLAGFSSFCFIPALSEMCMWPPRRQQNVQATTIQQFLLPITCCVFPLLPDSIAHHLPSSQQQTVLRHCSRKLVKLPFFFIFYLATKYRSFVIASFVSRLIVLCSLFVTFLLSSHSPSPFSYLYLIHYPWILSGMLRDPACGLPPLLLSAKCHH